MIFLTDGFWFDITNAFHLFIQSTASHNIIKYIVKYVNILIYALIYVHLKQYQLAPILRLHRPASPVRAAREPPHASPRFSTFQFPQTNPPHPHPSTALAAEPARLQPRSRSSRSAVFHVPSDKSSGAPRAAEPARTSVTPRTRPAETSESRCPLQAGTNTSVSNGTAQSRLRQTASIPSRSPPKTAPDPARYFRG